MGSSKKVTTGYRYYLGVHFGLCHGPVDSLLKIAIGERDAWAGNQTASGSVGIVQADLFGGDKREGGVVGILDVMMGESTQVENSYLQEKIATAIPAFRGILSAVWRGGQVTANNPYLKPWAFKVRRILQGWASGAAWYPAKASIVAAQNPCYASANTTVLNVGSAWNYKVVPYTDTGNYIGQAESTGNGPFADQLPHVVNTPPFLQTFGTVVSKVDTLWAEKVVSVVAGATITVTIKADTVSYTHLTLPTSV